MTYDAEIRSLTQETMYRLRVAQRAREHSKFGKRLLDRVPNADIRRRIKLYDVGRRVMKIKWSCWAGHLGMAHGHERWSSVATELRPITGKGMLAGRWLDGQKILSRLGQSDRTWMKLAQE